MTSLTRSTVQPASGDHHRDFNRRIELTPSDIQNLWSDYMHRGLLFHKPDRNPVEHLKAALSLALDRFYPLAGRLVTTEHDGNPITTSFHIECSGAGATFVHAEALNVTVAKIIDGPTVPMKIVQGLFPLSGALSGVLNYEAADLDFPLLAVQVTELADGIFVAVSLSHGAVDGTTFWDFFNVWSELARGDLVAVSRRDEFVFCRERFYGAVEFPVRIPFRRSEAPPRAVKPAPQQEQRVFRLSKDKIAALKAEIGAVSSLQALMGLLWVCVTRSRGLGPGDEVTFVIAVGMRPRLRPRLPKSYVGNAIALPVVTSTAGEVLEGGTGWAARRINETIAGYAEMETGEFLKECAKGSTPESAHLPPNMVLIGGSPRFDMYGTDFGWGRPLAHRNGLAGPPLGKINVSPGAVEGSVDLEVNLLTETFGALITDPEFTKLLISLN